MLNLGTSRRVLSGTDSRPAPGDFPLGSIESRAAARASVESKPSIAVLFSGRDPKFLADFAALDDMRGPVYERLPEESQKQFQNRMLHLPGRARGGLLTFFLRTGPVFGIETQSPVEKAVSLAVQLFSRMA